jgi:UDP-2,3-diacylglucosamine pyrophosphatase LpxH
MTTLFISDLHLEADRPEIGNQFTLFLEDEAKNAEALYILGDFFEAWVGDDDPDEYYATIKRSLRDLVDHGVPVYFMHGNRDFMIGDKFAAETGVKILPDPCPAEFYALHRRRRIPAGSCDDQEPRVAGHDTCEAPGGANRYCCTCASTKRGAQRNA